jgi:RimJ/RimL family protein N-acetyltransferase
MGESHEALARAWPLFGLRLRTGGIELRLPTDPELVALADLAAQGVHAPERMPFIHPWTRRRPPELQREFLRHHWSVRASCVPERWMLNLGVFREGEPVGSQMIRATSFAVTRRVGTGSWLGEQFQGQGIGTTMRVAVLAFAFDGLAALDAESGAFEDNPASLAVSRKLGYRPNGSAVHDREGQRAREQHLLLTAEDWRAMGRPRVTIEGMDACRELLGAIPGAATVTS